MGKWVLFGIVVVISGCMPADVPDPDSDLDGDGLTLAQEMSASTNPGLADSDGDTVWDGDELGIFGTDPTLGDTDGDGMNDRADPKPLTVNAEFPRMRYSVFLDDATGSRRVQISDTWFQENHVVFAPPTAVGYPFLIYQTYLDDGAVDGTTDGVFDEGDLPQSAIAVMELDGGRPRLLTDLDDAGRRLNNGAIDATPEPSPDGRFIIFASNRHQIGGVQLRLYVMGIDGASPRMVGYASDAPGENEVDADPHWGHGNTISFKRQLIDDSSRFSRVYTSTMDPDTMMLSNVRMRTSGEDEFLMGIGPGDFDPKISPDGTILVSYRHQGDGPGPLGDWDIWVAPVSFDAAPAGLNIEFLESDSQVADLFPRWNQAGNRLAFWRVEPNASPDPIDIVILDLNVESSPEFSVRVTDTRNITRDVGADAGIVWFETMPSWGTNEGGDELLVYSASRPITVR